MQKIEPYTKWTSRDGNRTLSVNSVGWQGDDEMAWGIASGTEPGSFSMTFDQIRADYTFVERF